MAKEQNDLKDEFKNFKNEVIDSLNKINNWSIIVGNALMNMANAIDKENKTLFNLICNIDIKLRQDVDFELNNFMRKYNYTVYNNNLEKTQLKTKINELDKELLSIKNITDINLIFHNSKFQ
ncbi:hypothetical protein [Spiroplasma sp. Moj]|uniref:hypothetical protein n=1 Tax=Spiroplasma sp. Moj TaxID=1922342 RepID=UPI0039F143E3|nr:hypothetical protein [Spiroplasma sp. Moj]